MTQKEMISKAYKLGASAQTAGQAYLQSENSNLSAKGKTLNPNYKKPIIRRAYRHTPHKMHGTLNRPIWVNVKSKDGAGFEQKLEKVKIALKKGLIKTA